MPEPSYAYFEGIEGGCTQKGREGSVLILDLDHVVDIPVDEKDARRSLRFEIWEVSQHLVTQSLVRFWKEGGTWQAKVARTRMRRLWPDALERMMRQAGFAEVEMTRFSAVGKKA